MQMQDSKLDEGYAYASRASRTPCARIPGAADVHIKQVLDYTTLQLDVDRQRA